MSSKKYTPSQRTRAAIPRSAKLRQRNNGTVVVTSSQDDALEGRVKRIEDMFYFADEDTIGTKYNFFSEKQNAAGSAGEPETGEGGGVGIIDSEMSDTSENAVQNMVIKEYIDKTDMALAERISALELNCGGGGSGSGGTTGGEGDKYYYHSQALAAEEWVIEHNLGKYPSVTVVSSAGEEIYCDKKHLSINKVVLNFGTAISGAAFLN